MDAKKFLEGDNKKVAIAFGVLALIAIVGVVAIYSAYHSHKPNAANYQAQKSKNSGAGVETESIFRFTTDTKRNEGLEDIKSEVGELKSMIGTLVKENATLKQGMKSDSSEAKGAPISKQNQSQNTGTSFDISNVPPPPADYSSDDSDQKGGNKRVTPVQPKPIKPSGPDIEVFSTKATEVTEKAKPALVLPIGSVIKSYMLTGVIASPANTALRSVTGGGGVGGATGGSMGGNGGGGFGSGSGAGMGGGSVSAQNMGTPFAARIKGDSILPNGFTVAELNDCFLVGSAKADLSQSRAMVIGKKISCIKPNGEIYTADFTAFGQDEDGITGLAGKVVFKASSALARTFAAGILGGLGQALAPQPMQSFNSNATNGQSQNYQVPNMQYLFGSSFGNGVASASTLLAKYYLAFAEQMMPVIEVPNATPVTWILTEELVFTSKTNPANKK